jgi:ADP-L-glycero-D-manno-heptose 6-epimerase
LQKPELNGIFNVGTGLARSWNDLAVAVFKAMDLQVKIEYVDMPMELAGKYQNYTEADSNNLRAAGLMEHMHSLEDGVRDYVRNYLAGSDPRL